MIKICFVCLGNICRSPLAEFILKEKVKMMNLEKEFLIVSRATSYEEDGNSMHYGAKEILNKNNIPYTNHVAKRLEKDDYNKYDYFVCMDDSNVINTLKIFNTDRYNKIIKLLGDRDVKDPWYTGDFEETYRDINYGLDNLIKKIK
ncbi:MAG: low molecular weight phosphotyrosine protein phosphatase [Bacilli bacterium]|nr:low molecular weight phosphotyrosine protein phosphatase [Bacilli bacterium]